jgi:hypothetical protein
MDWRRSAGVTFASGSFESMKTLYSIYKGKTLLEEVYANSATDALRKYKKALRDEGFAPEFPYRGKYRAVKSKNPTLLFRTRAAALKYAREHGAKRFSIKKLKRGR